MMLAPRYIVHQTGYERDAYILKSLLAHVPGTLPLPALRRTTWHVRWLALDEIVVDRDVSSIENGGIQRLVDELRAGQPIEPILVFGPEKRLLVGHLHVAALRTLGVARALAYHGDWLEPGRAAPPELKSPSVA